MLRRPPKGLSLLSPLLILLIWEALARGHAIDVRFFPAPSAILGAGWGTVRSGELWANLTISLSRIGLGFALGAAPGIVLGVVMGLVPWIRLTCMPVVSSIYPIRRAPSFP